MSVFSLGLGNLTAGNGLVIAGTTISVNAAQSVTVSGGPVTLVNDIPTPPAQYLYSTNSAGTRGWFPISFALTGASGSLTSLIALTGQQAWTAANNNGINSSGALVSASGYLLNLIQAAGGVLSLNGVTGVLMLTSAPANANYVKVTTSGTTIMVSGDMTPLLTGVTLADSGNYTPARAASVAQLLAASGWLTNATTSNVVYTTGAQTIGGTKTFSTGILLGLSNTTGGGINWPDVALYRSSASTVIVGGAGTAFGVSSNGGSAVTALRSAGTNGIDIGVIGGDAGATRIYSNQNVALTADTSQRIGIGITSPLARLHVSGGIVRGEGDAYFAVSGGRVGIGTTSPAYTLEISGSMGATTKSFDIPHPLRGGKWRLAHGVTESPAHTVFLNGDLRGSGTISFPPYWAGLVHSETIKVQVTPMGRGQHLNVSYVSITGASIDNEGAGGERGIIAAWRAEAERKDVPRLIVEKEIL